LPSGWLRTTEQESTDGLRDLLDRLATTSAFQSGQLSDGRARG